MITAQAHVGARGFDSYPYCLGGTALSAKAMRAAGGEFFTPYLGVIDQARLGYLLEENFAIIPVTLGATEHHLERFNGRVAAAATRALGIPLGCHVILDVEDVSHMNAQALSGLITEWTKPVKGEGYRAGMYLGLPQCLTSEELWQLSVDFYWKAPGRTVDRFQQLAEPSGCGWGAYQCYDTIKVGGLDVDVDFIHRDFKRRLPYWAVKAP